MNKLVLLLIVLQLCGFNFAQSLEQRIVARIGSEIITEDEFIERYELTPQIYAGMKGAEVSLKQEVLFSIIAERLWAIEAESQGLADSDLFKYKYRTVEKMYVRDALFRQEILNRVKLDDDYLNEAYRRNSLRLKLNYLFSIDEKEINEVYQQLENGQTFDSIFLNRPESGLQKEPYEVRYGQMEKVVEDDLYNLKIGEITKPIKAPNGWYIFKLLSSEENIIENSEQAESERKNVLRIAEATIIDSLYKDFYSEFFNDLKAETNRELFIILSDIVIKTLRNKNNSSPAQTGEKIFLNPDDLYKIEYELGPDKLNSEFIRLGDQPETLDNFLQELSIEKFFVDSLNADHIRGRLNYYIKNFIEHELLAREGYKRKLQDLPEVNRYLKMWRTYFLNDILRKKIADTLEVSDEEINKYFIEHNQTNTASTEVKLIELLTDDLDIIRTSLELLQQGVEFRDIAIKYTIREETKSNNGELGFFPVNEYGEIGIKAASMQIGEMYGPLIVPEGYSLFKLIDKRSGMVNSNANSEAEKENIKLELLQKKYSDEILNKTIGLANNYNVTIDEETLSSIKVMNTTTIVYRYFGFGGRLLAVPITIPNYLWVKPWQDQKEITP